MEVVGRRQRGIARQLVSGCTLEKIKCYMCGFKFKKHLSYKKVTMPNLIGSE